VFVCRNDAYEKQSDLCRNGGDRELQSLPMRSFACSWQESGNFQFWCALLLS